MLAASVAARADYEFTPISPAISGKTSPSHRGNTDELFTPPLPALAGNFLQCSIVNVSAETRAVRIRYFDSLGNQVADSGEHDLGGSEGFGLSLPASAAGFYCSFSVAGSGNKFRASISVLQPGVGLISALPAE